MIEMTIESSASASIDELSATHISTVRQNLEKNKLNKNLVKQIQDSTVLDNELLSIASRCAQPAFIHFVVN